MTPTLYFAYGSNMDVCQMGKRCPRSTLVGVGQLANYKFIINSRGVATLVPNASAFVFGVLWNLTQEDEESLDYYEGVPKHYKKCRESVEHNGVQRRALIYIANDFAVGPPRPGYMERIVAAAEQHGFDHNYLHELNVWINVPIS